MSEPPTKSPRMPRAKQPAARRPKKTSAPPEELPAAAAEAASAVSGERTGGGTTIAAGIAVAEAGPARAPAAVAPVRKPINLALQGGGSHGAFTWGVLDRLLEDERLSFEGVSGSSAGAMNGAIFTCGLVEGGPQRARALLAEFWERVSSDAWMSPFQPTLWDRITGNHSLNLSPLYQAFDLSTRIASPYQLNPFNYNPLRPLLIEMIDFERLRSAVLSRLYVSATDVLTGRLKLFAGPELSVDAVLASACLPQLFQAVKIGGAYYWDGGYMGNPTLYPLVHACEACDIVVVQINPINRTEVPTTPAAILDRLNEISFNSTFLREVRSLHQINRLLRDGYLKEESGLRPVHLHMIEAEAAMGRLDVSSKLNSDWGFLRDLHALGREAAAGWLVKRFAALGTCSTYGTDTEDPDGDVNSDRGERGLQVAPGPPRPGRGPAGRSGRRPTAARRRSTGRNGSAPTESRGPGRSGHMRH